MVLLFGARDSTKDVDAFHLDPDARPRVAAAAASVAESLELPSDWLNDAAKGYVHGLSLGAVVMDTPTLRVRTLSVSQLLAMKLSAWRDDLDVEDARRGFSDLQVWDGGGSWRPERALVVFGRVVVGQVWRVVVRLERGGHWWSHPRLKMSMAMS